MNQQLSENMTLDEAVPRQTNYVAKEDVGQGTLVVISHMTLDDIDLLIPHQANGRILDALGERLRITPERVLRTVYNFGNMSAASNVLALDFAFRYGNLARKLDDEGRVVEVYTQPEHRIQAGELVLMPTIGGGYLMGCAGFIAEPALVEGIQADQVATDRQNAHGPA